MQINFEEHDGCFAFKMTPETVADTAKIARLKINGTKNIRGIYASFYKDGTVSGSVVIGKRRQPKAEMRG